jgi:hypothetical protein
MSLVTAEMSTYHICSHRMNKEVNSNVKLNDYSEMA